MDYKDLEERTLVVRNIDGDRLTNELLEELFANFGPVVRVILRARFAFIEYTCKESVAYAWAMMQGIYFKDRPLYVEPKRFDNPDYRAYRESLDKYRKKLTRESGHIDHLLSEEQLEEKKNLISKLERGSVSTMSTIRRRLHAYGVHYVPESYNPLLRQEIGERKRSSDSKSESNDRRERERDRERDRDRDRDRRDRHPSTSHKLPSKLNNLKSSQKHTKSMPDLRDTLNSRHNSSSTHRPQSRGDRRESMEEDRRRRSQDRDIRRDRSTSHRRRPNSSNRDRDRDRDRNHR